MSVCRFANIQDPASIQEKIVQQKRDAEASEKARTTHWVLPLTGHASILLHSWKPLCT